MNHRTRSRRSLAAPLIAVVALLALAPAAFAGQAVYSTVNVGQDGSTHCKNGNPPVNCNTYDGKQYVWINGGPSNSAIVPDGQYFFVVVEPGGQNNSVNDGGPKNLSDDFDAYTNRTFTVTNGKITATSGTHAFLPDSTVSNRKELKLFPYATTSNSGGNYIVAACSLAHGYPVDPSDCKTDMFKVSSEIGRASC